MAPTPDDDEFMNQALALAAQGTALASPNPRVGAVVVRDGVVVGRGFHRYDDPSHAEALALAEAGERARGATLYVNLEPCSHRGRTPPCAEAVVSAGVRRVVAAIADPNPLVAGRGLERLRQAGIAIEVGCRAEEARQLNQGFAHWIRHRRPFVTLKAGMTLDGKIAAPPTASSDGTRTHEWITSEAARWHVQQLRHEQDAVMVGVGTVLADNPWLTDRTGQERRRPLLRVILDSQLRLPLDARLVRTARQDVVVFCSRPDDRKRAQLQAAGVRVETVAPAAASAQWGGRPDPEQVLARLGAWDITSLIVEGGSVVNGMLLQMRAVNRVFLYYAPKLLAGAAGVPFAAGAGFATIREAMALHDLTLHRFGPDFAVEGLLTDPYAED
ncbi:MAG: bifunctional diaminohydroxyphosphoribosylaminopyrimidine deaminase/5-amino-6-(5-phosphoribosylamino)uracil reductase RibD [Terriglobales bacterium]